MEVCLFDLIFFTTERGDSPIDEFLDGLDKKSRAKVAAYLSLLEEEGPNLKRPYADVIRGKIRELGFTIARINTASFTSFMCAIRLSWFTPFPRRHSN
jgi:Phage derived protein Gp49-like (DUF891)